MDNTSLQRRLRRIFCTYIYYDHFCNQILPGNSKFLLRLTLYEMPDINPLIHYSQYHNMEGTAILFVGTMAAACR
jgi:hypothetical protein